MGPFGLRQIDSPEATAQQSGTGRDARMTLSTLRSTIVGGKRTPKGAIMGNITSMALTRKKATTIALDPEDDRLLTRAARDRGVSRSEFIRQQLSLVLEQYRRHPRPASAGVIARLRERGDEDELFGKRR